MKRDEIEPALINRMAFNFQDAVRRNDIDTICDICRSLGFSPEKTAELVIFTRNALGRPHPEKQTKRNHLHIVK
jgi:hypothetical protein